MSENNHKAVLPLWMIIIDLICLVAAFIFDLICLMDSSLTTYTALSLLTSVLTVLSGTYYCFSGYKKNGSLFFKMFVYAFSLNHLFILVGFTQLGCSAALAFLFGISYGLLTILAAALNLGKKRSFMLAGSVFLCHFISLIIHLVTPTVEKSSKIYFCLSGLLLSILLLICVYAKYKDKVNRNREV